MIELANSGFSGTAWPYVNQAVQQTQHRYMMKRLMIEALGVEVKI
jgi:hypothetical protein